MKDDEGVSDRSEYGRLMPQAQVEAVLARYDLPPIIGAEPGAGTASPKLILTTAHGRFLLKRRRAEFSVPEVVAFDHSVIERLGRNGLPVACPIEARGGEKAVFLGDWAFEVAPFLENLLPFDQGSEPHLVSASRLLARFHNCARDLQPAGRKDWRREMHAAVNARTLREHLSEWELACPSDDRLPLARRTLELLDTTARALPDERVAALPHYIVHGDFTHANLGYLDDEVAGLFDFDWTYRQSRLVDLNRLVLFFGFTRKGAIDSGSIWSLVQAPAPDMARARLALDAYARDAPLTDEERACLPWFVREMALSMRVRAMRKVADEEKLDMLTRDMGPLMDWLESGANALEDT